MSKLTDFPVYSAKTKKKALKIMVVGAFLVIVLMGGLFYRGSFVDMDPGKISVTLNAQVIRDGVLINEITKDDDMILENLEEVIEVLLRWTDGADGNINLKDVGGVTGDYAFIQTTTSDNTIWDADECNSDVQATYGEGTTAPARTDYDAETEKTSKTGISSYIQETDSFTLTWIKTNAVGAFDWSETTFQIQWYSWDLGDYIAIAMVRDTFTPMGVVNGDTLVINYRFNFASGYTTNFITLLLGTLRGTSGGASTTISMKDTAGVSHVVTLYDGEQSANFYGYAGSSLYGGYLLVSTSSSGIPSRDAYRLLGSSLQTTVTTSVDYDADDVIVSAVFIPTSVIWIVASAYYRYTVNADGSNYFMFFGLSHGSVYVTAGTPVKSTFTVGL